MREKLRSELASKSGINKLMSRGRLSGPQSRNFAASAQRGIVRPSLPTAGILAKPELASIVRSQDGLDLSRNQVAGSSRVAFVGPATDGASRKKRSCKWSLSTDLINPHGSGKTTICTRRSRRGVLVCFASIYTVTTPLNRRPVLDDRIDYFGTLVKDYYNIEELGDPSAVTDVSGPFEIPTPVVSTECRETLWS